MGSEYLQVIPQTFYNLQSKKKKKKKNVSIAFTQNCRADLLGQFYPSPPPTPNKKIKQSQTYPSHWTTKNK